MFEPFISDDDPTKVSETHDLDGKNVAIIATGSIAAMYLPAWLAWFSDNHSRASLRTILTRSALHFVGLHAVNAYTQNPAIIDDWDSVGHDPLHVDLADWADGFLIHPATIDYASRLATGLCNSPSLLALQGTCRPIVVAPALPPGYMDSQVWNSHTNALNKRTNVRLLQPVKGESSSRPGLEAYPPQAFPIAIRALSRALKEQDRSAKS